MPQFFTFLRLNAYLNLEFIRSLAILGSELVPSATARILIDSNSAKIANLGKVKDTVTAESSGTQMVLMMAVTVTGVSPLMVPAAVVVDVAVATTNVVAAVVEERLSCSDGVR